MLASGQKSTLPNANEFALVKFLNFLPRVEFGLQLGALCRFEWNFMRRGNVMLPNYVDSPTPTPALKGGEVLAAGRARGPAANPASNPKPLSVKVFSMPSRVRCPGLRLPLTAPKTPSRLQAANRRAQGRAKCGLSTSTRNDIGPN